MSRLSQETLDSDLRYEDERVTPGQVAWVPRLCDAIRQYKHWQSNVYKRKCKVVASLPKDFEILRGLAASLDRSNASDKSDALERSLLAGPLQTFKPGAGLSASTFASTWDKRFMLKLGLLQKPGIDEPGSLQALVKGSDGLQKLSQHLRLHTESLLNRYYGLVRIELGPKKSGRFQWCVWMEDASYFVSEQAAANGVLSPKHPSEYEKGDSLSCETHDGSCVTRYDLKGLSREPDRTSKPDNYFTLENGDYRRREYDFLRLGSQQCKKLRRTVMVDAQFLESYGLIDYSLFVTSVEKPSLVNITCADTDEPLCLENRAGNRLYTVSLIDYLQQKSVYHSVVSTLVTDKTKNRRGKYARYAEKIISFTRRSALRDQSVSKPSPMRARFSMQSRSNTPTRLPSRHSAPSSMHIRTVGECPSRNWMPCWWS